MVLRVGFSQTGDSAGYDLGTQDDFSMPAGEFTVNTLGAVVVGTGKNQSVRVLGDIYGRLQGIEMGNEFTGDGFYSVHVGKTGSVQGQFGAITLNGSSNTLTNFGEISTDSDAAISLVSGLAGIGTTIHNHGTISSPVVAIVSYGIGSLNLNNSGLIQGSFNSVVGAAGDDRINNRGEIDGAIFLYNGQDWLINRGMIDGAVDTGAGADVVQNIGGTITGEIDLGADSDTFIAGASVETVDGGTNPSDAFFGDTLDFSKSSGVKIALDESIVATGWARDDSYSGFENLIGARKGNDLLIGDDGGNSLQGLGGNDVLRGLAGADSLLGAAGNDKLDGGDDADTLDGGAGNDSLRGGAGNDDLSGGTGNDKLDGDDDADTLDGGAGNDSLRGGAGNDDLSGGTGNDIVSGGAGSDVVRGGAGADTFAFLLLDIAPLAETTGDVIAEFSSAEGDRIDLSAIDANRLVAKNQAFTFIGSTAFSKVAGELRYEVVGPNDIYLSGDTNGDGKADFVIGLSGPSNVASLVANDFVL